MRSNYYVLCSNISHFLHLREGSITIHHTPHNYLKNKLNQNKNNLKNEKINLKTKNIYRQLRENTKDRIIEVVGKILKQKKIPSIP